MIRTALFAIALMFCFSPQAHAIDWSRCLERDYLYHFDPRLSAQACELVTTETIHWRGGMSVLHVIHPRSMPPINNVGVFNARVRQAAVEIGQAMDRMGGSLRLDNVTLLTTNFVSPREAATDRDPGLDKGAYEAAANSTFQHECPVSYYKSDLPVADGGEFAFVLAHEVFHCIQFRTWPAMLDDGWLQEGTAEYFAYLAHPGYGAGHIAGFDANIPFRALNTMDYPAVAFYLWMGDANGPASVREFIASTRSFQAAVTPDMWIMFGQR